MKEQLKVFHANLEEFAKKHKKDINKNPEFRKHFQDMCTRVGVDPLACKNHGFLRLNSKPIKDFGPNFLELEISTTNLQFKSSKVGRHFAACNLPVCLRTRGSNGGLIEINELTNYLTKMRGSKSKEITSDDIERAARKIKSLGSGFQVLSIGSQRLIQSVPCELNTDHTTVLVLAQKKGYVTSSILIKELTWTQDRVSSVLVSLLVIRKEIDSESVAEGRNGLGG